MSKVARRPTYKSLVQLPPLPAEEYEGLRSSIAANGVIVPIIVWKNKYIIDGAHRKQITDEFGYECPEIARPDLDEEEARLMARALNLARRQLDREQKRRQQDRRRIAASMVGFFGQPETIGQARTVPTYD